MSSGKFSSKSDVMSYRAHFKHVWCEFIHDNFEGPEQVAYVFKVDADTSRKWWAGSHAPQSWIIGAAGKLDSDIRDKLINHLWGGAA